MARSSHKLYAAHKLALLLCAAAIGSTVAGNVVKYSIPAFDATTADDYLIELTNSTVLTSTSIFGPGAINPGYNSSEGFLILSQPVDFWRAGSTDVEASFNTSFTLVAGAAPVSFVVRAGAANHAMSPGGPVPSNATGSLASVEVTAVRSYVLGVPTAGLNVTVSPTGTAPGGRTVWVEYHAAEHRLSVYVAGAGEPRPTDDLLTTPLGVDGHWTAESTFVGFFTAMVRDVIVGVRDWNLTVEKLPEQSVANGNTGTSIWLVVLLAVLGSVAATSTV